MKNNITKAVAGALVSLTVCACRTMTNASTNKVNAITVLVTVPVMAANEGKFIDVQDSLTLIYNDNFTVVRTSRTNSFFKLTVDSTGGITNQKLLRQEEKYRYFVHSQNSPVGCVYDSSTGFAKKLSVDSFYRNKSLFKPNVFDDSTDSLLWSRMLSKGFLEETYISKIKKDPSFPDTTKFYYSKTFSSIDYSFSRFLDSTRALKLFKVEMIFNEPRHELTFEIKKTEFIDTATVLAIIRRSKNECFK